MDISYLFNESWNYEFDGYINSYERVKDLDNWFLVSFHSNEKIYIKFKYRGRLSDYKITSCKETVESLKNLIDVFCRKVWIYENRDYLINSILND